MKFLGPPQSGSVANQTYARNPFGQYVRGRGPANNSPSGERDASRATFAAGVAEWQALTDAQRIEWMSVDQNVRHHHRVGGEGPLGGFDRFMSAWMASNGETIAPTIDRAIATPAAVPMFFGSSSPVWDLTISIVITAPCWVPVYTMGYTTVSTYSAPGRGRWWKRIALADLTAPGSFPQTVSILIQAAQEGLWGPVVSGSRTFCRVRALATGGVLSAPSALGWIDWV